VTPSRGAPPHPGQTNGVETYTHVVKGIKDVVAQQAHEYGDNTVWEARRIELAHFVRDEMRSQDSVTCRSCHDAKVIRPVS
jgi:nitrate/TMAO reductase-like tetraheme cytochrome c subunit